MAWVQALPAYFEPILLSSRSTRPYLERCLGFRGITWVREFTDSTLICAVAVIAAMLGPLAIVWRALRWQTARTPPSSEGWTLVLKMGQWRRELSWPRIGLGRGKNKDS